MAEEGFAAVAKSYREFVESAQQVVKLHDRRRSSVLQNIRLSKQLFFDFMKQKRAEEGYVVEEEYDSSSSEDGPNAGLLEDSMSTVNTSKRSKFIDDDNMLVDLKAPHLAQQQQRPSQNGYNQNLEMTLTPLYDIDLYLHFDKKKRKIRKKLYPYLTRLQNSRNEKEFIRVRPILHNSGYANNSLWSKRSIQIEQTLRLYLTPQNISNRGSSTSLVSRGSVLSSENFAQYVHENISLYNKIPIGFDVSFVDTFWSDEECNPNLEIINRLTSSDGTAITQERALHKETYRQLEFDLLLLNMVNDYMSLYKQIHSAAGFEQFLIDNNILHDNTHLIKVLKKKNEVAEMFNEIYAQHFAANKEEKKHDSMTEVSSDGNYKCEGMLIGIAASNDLHIRPLCTSADMSLAINELQDPRVFKYGYIAMPHMLQMNLERFYEGFYRFEYHAKDGFSIKYMKINLPTANKDLKPFLGMASYIVASECLEEEWLYTTLKAVPNRKMSPRNKSPLKTFHSSVRDGSLVPTALLEFCNKLVRNLNDVYRKFTKVILSTVFDIEALIVLRDYQKSNVTGAPHHIFKNADAEQIQYRVLSFHHMEVRECLTHFRRKAVCSIDGIQRNFLKDFYREFKKEWNSIVNGDHAMNNIEDFYSLSAAQRSAIRYAHKVYGILKENGDAEADVFELDLEDVEAEFMKQLQYGDAPVTVREKNHLESKVLIEKFRPIDETLINTDDLNTCQVGARVSDNFSTSSCGAMDVVKPLVAIKMNSSTVGSQAGSHGGSHSSSLTGSRRQSKFERKQSTVRVLKKKKSTVGSRLRSNESDSDFSLDGIKEIDPFEKEKEIAGAQYAESFIKLMQSADQSAVLTLQQRISAKFAPKEHNQNNSGDNVSSSVPLSFIDPYRGKLKLLCDGNASKAYHQSFNATKELLLHDESGCSQKQSPAKKTSAVKKIGLDTDIAELDRLDHFSDSESESQYRGREAMQPFPYLQRLNREAYRLAEKLDVLTVMMLGSDVRTIDTSKAETTKNKKKNKSKPTEIISPTHGKKGITSSTQASPLVTPVGASNTPNGNAKHFTFESIQPTNSKDSLTSKEKRSQYASQAQLSIDEEDDLENEENNSSRISPLRTYLRRFSQRFKGLNLQEELIYSDTESDPDKSDSDESDPRELGLTEQGKHQEEQKMLEMILTSIDPHVAERIRKGLLLREERLRLIRRQEYIRRRRQQEELSEEKVKQLKEYFDRLPPNQDPFSSSSDEEDIQETTKPIIKLIPDNQPPEEPPTDVTFKRSRGNTIRKTTPAPMVIHLAHRSTNVTIDPSFYERLSSRQSTVGSSTNSSTPFPSRPLTTNSRPSMLLGNVTIDGLTLPKDSSKASIWEQMTDTLSSICDDVDNEAASFHHFNLSHAQHPHLPYLSNTAQLSQQEQEQLQSQHLQAFHRQRRMGMARFVTRTGGKLWGDNMGSTMLISRKENIIAEPILEGSSSTAVTASTSEFSEGGGTTTTTQITAPSSAATILQISHFATEYCYELFEVSIASVSNRLVAIENMKQKFISNHRRASAAHARHSMKMTSPRLSAAAVSAAMVPAAPISPIPEIKRSTIIQNFTRKTQFNMVDEFNKIFNEPLRSSNGFQEQNRLHNPINDVARFNTSLEEVDDHGGYDHQDESRTIVDDNIDSTNSSNFAIGNDDLVDLLQVMKSNHGSKVDPLLTLTSPVNGNKRPYSCGTLASNSGSDILTDIPQNLDPFQKFINSLKPKSSYSSRMEYDQQTRNQWKQKLATSTQCDATSSLKASNSNQRSQSKSAAPVKFGIKGLKALPNAPLNQNNEVSPRKRDHPQHRDISPTNIWPSRCDEVPEQDDEVKSVYSSLVSTEWVNSSQDQLNTNATDVRGYLDTNEASKSLEDHACTDHPNQSLDNSTVNPNSTSGENPRIDNLRDSNSIQGWNLPSIEIPQPPTDSVISFPSLSQLQTKVQFLLEDSFDESDTARGMDDSRNRAMTPVSPMVSPERHLDEKYHDDRLLTTKIHFEEHELSPNSKPGKYFASSMISSIYNVPNNKSSKREATRSPSPPNKGNCILTSPPAVTMRPSMVSPNQRKRMLKSAHLSDNNDIRECNDGSKLIDMDGILKTGRPVTLTNRLKQSDYLK